MSKLASFSIITVIIRHEVLAHLRFVSQSVAAAGGCQRDVVSVNLVVYH